MSDFSAIIKASLNTTAVDGQIKSIGNKKVEFQNITFDPSALETALNQALGHVKINFGAGNLNFQPFIQPFQNAGANAGQAFTNSIRSQINANMLAPAQSAIANLTKSLTGKGLEQDAITHIIDSITASAKSADIQITKISDAFQNAGKNVGQIKRFRIEGIDSLGNAIHILDTFDAKTGQLNNSVTTVTRSFTSVTNSANAMSGATKQALENVLNTGLSNGKFKADLDMIDLKFKELGTGSTQLSANLQQLKQSFDTMNDANNTMDVRITAMREYLGLLPGVRAQISELKAEETAAAKATQQALGEMLNSGLSNGKFKADLDMVELKFKALGTGSTQLSTNLQQLKQSFDTMNDTNNTMDVRIAAMQDYLGMLPGVRAQISALSAEESAAAKATAETNRALKETAQQASVLQKSSILSNNIQAWMNNNTKAAETFGAVLRDIQDQLKNNTSSDKLAQLNTRFREIQSEAKKAGLTTDSFATSIKNVGLQVLGLGSSVMIIRKVIAEIRTACNTVIELDTALIDLQKTTKATAQELSNYYYEANDIAKTYGATTKEIIQSSADWSRLGYNLEDSKTMAKVSSIFKSISPGLSNEEATDGLVSVMKAFDIEAKDALDGIASKINIIGNTQAVSNKDIVEFLRRSSSAMKEANNALEDTIALGTAATEITRDATSVGNALKTVSMRIRGYDEETEEYVGGLEELSGDIADLTKTVEHPLGISLFKDEAKTEFKSTLELLRDISTIYDELTDKQQASLLEKLAGKRGGQIVASILNNFEAVENSLETMQNSAGTAEAEMSIITESLTFKLNKLKETGTGIFQNLFPREDIGTVVDLLSSILSVLDKITETIGLLGTVLTSVAIVKVIKSIS